MLLYRNINNLYIHDVMYVLQIYIYGYNDDMEVIKRPSQLCHYAVINFTFMGPSIVHKNRSSLDISFDVRLNSNAASFTISILLIYIYN